MARGTLCPGPSASRVGRAPSAVSLGRGRAMIVTTRTRITWAVAAVVGLAVGATLSTLVVTAVGRPLSPQVGGLIYVGLYRAVIGCVTGIVQLAVIPRGVARWYAWPLASIVGFGVGYVLASLVGEALGN